MDELGEEPGDPGDNPGEPGDDDGERLNDDEDDDEEDEGGAYLATVSSTSTASSVNAVSSCSPHPQPSYQTTAVNCMLDRIIQSARVSCSRRCASPAAARFCCCRARCPGIGGRADARSIGDS